MNKIRIVFNNVYIPERVYGLREFETEWGGNGHWVKVVRKLDHEEVFCAPAASVCYVEMME